MSQTMKPQTAADKLGIYLPAAPAEFRQTPISREDLDALRDAPPEWLTQLRRNGPFPRDVVAQKLGVSKAGLARGGLTEALDTDEVGALLADPPQWLQHERSVQRKRLAEEAEA